MVTDELPPVASLKRPPPQLEGVTSRMGLLALPPDISKPSRRVPSAAFLTTTTVKELSSMVPGKPISPDSIVRFTVKSLWETDVSFPENPPSTLTPEGITKEALRSFWLGTYVPEATQTSSPMRAFERASGRLPRADCQELPSPIPPWRTNKTLACRLRRGRRRTNDSRSLCFTRIVF